MQVNTIPLPTLNHAAVTRCSHLFREGDPEPQEPTTMSKSELPRCQLLTTHTSKRRERKQQKARHVFTNIVRALNLFGADNLSRIVEMWEQSSKPANDVYKAGACI
eukprot:3146369-Amphidinium_carterae.1